MGMTQKDIDSRRTQMRQLRRLGWTLQQIAAAFSVSRQRVHQVIGNTGGGRYGRPK